MSHDDEFDGDRHALADHLRDVHDLADEVHEILFHHQGMEPEMLGDLHQEAHGCACSVVRGVDYTTKAIHNGCSLHDLEAPQ